jgi:RNA polymerase sigma-70 factor (ECF subfamily)
MYLTHSEFLAEEITQEVFLKIWLNHEQMGELEYFNAYLRTVAKNVACNHLKHIAIEKLAIKNISNQATLHETSNQSDTTIYNDLRKIFEAAVETLPPQQKRAYVLYHRQGVKQKDIATQMNLSIHTVKEYLKNATMRVRSYVDSRISLVVVGVIDIFLS